MSAKLKLVPAHDCGWSEQLNAITIPGKVTYGYDCPECGRRYSVEGWVSNNGTHRGTAHPKRGPSRSWIKQVIAATPSSQETP